jgi:uncharacterized damage-inducible protein DinB
MTSRIAAGARRAAVLTVSTLALFASGISGAEEPVSGPRSLFNKEWGWAVERIKTLAEAIPDETYGWRPDEGVRSTSEALMHIAGGNFMFADSLGVPRPEDLPEDLAAVTDKAEVLTILDRSFQQMEAGIEAAFADDLDRKNERFGTVRGVLLRALVHANEHLGQLVAYGRSNGVVPPWSQ